MALACRPVAPVLGKLSYRYEEGGYAAVNHSFSLCARRNHQEDAKKFSFDVYEACTGWTKGERLCLLSVGVFRTARQWHVVLIQKDLTSCRTPRTRGYEVTL